MKKIALLAFSIAAAAIAVSCTKDETTSRDADLAGVNVAVGEEKGTFSKLFVLNEGNFLKNNSTLDFLRFSDGNYVSDAFGSMNPTVPQGLGDTGNDLALRDGKLWLLMNGSSTVHILDAEDETLIASVAIPDPRYVAFDDTYAYVSSYAGAVFGGEAAKGKVFRINRKTYKTEGSVETGCQPEGVAVAGNKLYVANSGGYNTVHDDFVSVVDLDSFAVTESRTVASNLHFLTSSSNGDVWISSYGESTWTQDAEGGWIQSMSEPMGLYRLSGGVSSRVDGVHVSCMTLCGDVIYAVGNDEELTGGYALSLYKVSTISGKVSKTAFSGTDAASVGNPYGILVNPENEDIYIADASYTGPGSVKCFDKNLKLKWSAVAGMIPGHMVLY